jgi:hypothetical protein
MQIWMEFKLLSATVILDGFQKPTRGPFLRSLGLALAPGSYSWPSALALVKKLALAFAARPWTQLLTLTLAFGEGCLPLPSWPCSGPRP